MISSTRRTFFNNAFHNTTKRHQGSRLFANFAAFGFLTGGVCCAAASSSASTPQTPHQPNSSSSSWFAQRMMMLMMYPFVAAGRQQDERNGADDGVAFCSGSKAPDTPEYLIPYYLRDTRSRFFHYASIRDNKSRKMSPEDFLSAMLALPEKIDDPDATRHFANFFKWADADGDGTINYREFAFLANILAYPTRDFRVLFKLFDKEDKGGLTPQQFSQMLVSVSDDNMKPKMRSGIVRAMFLPEEHKRFLGGESRPLCHRDDKSSNKSDHTSGGEEKSSPPRLVADKVPDNSMCSFERFSSVVRHMEKMMSEAEFRVYDTGAKGYVSREQFGKMILSSIHGRHLPYFLVDNLKRLGDGDSSDNKNVNIETYHLFSEMIRSADRVASALQLYAAGGYVIKPEDLKRALDRSVHLSRPVTMDEAKLIVTMFDANSDGELHIDEFVNILRAKASYAGVLPKEKSRANLFSRLVECTAEGYKELTQKDGDEI